MILNYFSPAHLIYISAATLFVAGLLLLIRKRSERIQKILVFALMLLNVLQHLFKMQIYPQYEPGFNALSSAYNMCAVLILISPIAYLSKSKTLKDFAFYMGSAAGAVALLIPYWNVGSPAFTWDIYRFFICHTLLLASSILPLLLGHHKPSWKCFPKIGMCFFEYIALIILNDIVFICMGLYPDLSSENLYESLLIANPAWSFAPPAAFPFVVDIAKALSPDIFVGANPAGIYVPVLWYFIPVYLGITLLAFPVCALVDRQNFVSDMRSYKTKLNCLFKKNKKTKD